MVLCKTTVSPLLRHRFSCGKWSCCSVVLSKWYIFIHYTGIAVITATGWRCLISIYIVLARLWLQLRLLVVYIFIRCTGFAVITVVGERLYISRYIALTWLWLGRWWGMVWSHSQRLPWLTDMTTLCFDNETLSLINYHIIASIIGISLILQILSSQLNTAKAIKQPLNRVICPNPSKCEL